jgi:hypothetical protein
MWSGLARNMTIKANRHGDRSAETFVAVKVNIGLIGRDAKFLG